jgi:predicted outer membrane repeat protein
MATIRRRMAAIVVLVVLAASAMAGSAAAAPRARCLVTDLGADRTYGSLQAAVDAAAPGARIRVKGTCVGGTSIGKDLTIIGFANPAFGRPTLDGAGAGRVVGISGSAVVTLRNLLITGGNADVGGGIATIVPVPLPFARPTVTIIDSVISGNSAAEGGGIDNGLGSLTLINSAVRNNTATNGGGIHNSRDFGTLSILGTSEVSQNAATGRGGGIYSATNGSITVSGSSSVHHNTAGGDGGGMYAEDSIVVLNAQASIHHNSAGGSGGGVFVASVMAALLLNGGSSISGNTPNDVCRVNAGIVECSNG